MRIRILCSIAAVMALMAHNVGAQRAAGWVNATGTLAHKLSECGTVTLLSAVPDSEEIIAGISGRGLWKNASADSTLWTRIDGNPERIPNRASSIVYDPTNPAVFWESGAYGFGLYKTSDAGHTFKRLGDVSHSDTISVDVNDPQRRTMLAGGHEQNQTVYLSVDGGENWTNIGVNLPSGSGHSSHPMIVNALTYLVDTNNTVKAGGGIYRSRDGGDSWQRVSATPATVGGLLASQSVVYWPANGMLMRSIDFGATWTATGSGVKNVTPVELTDGRIVAVGPTTLVATSNRGATWAPLGPPLPFEPSGIIYSPQRKAVYIWRSPCLEEVPGNAVLKLDVEVEGVSDTPASAVAQ